MTGQSQPIYFFLCGFGLKLNSVCVFFLFVCVFFLFVSFFLHRDLLSC